MKPTIISTREDLDAFVAAVEGDGYVRPAAYGLGLATIAPSGKVLDTAFAHVNLGELWKSAAVLADVCGHRSGTATYRVALEQVETALSRFAPFENDGKVHPNRDVLKGVAAALRGPGRPGGERVAVVVFVGDLADKPVDAHDVYFRLHLLSHRKVRPHGVNLDGQFGLLNNVVWTNHGPFDPDGFELARLGLQAEGREVNVHSIDKFPRMLDYVIPSGVRIADAGRVRLGAHLSEGTTVMHEGFCNFNAGTLGASMVEGRISAGVVVGDGSDIGGGASIMGTLSGGGKEVVSLGEKCLLGANGGLGIALGDNCIVEAGCYVTAGSRVKLPDGTVVKARELSGKSNLLFRRNSQTGALEVLPNGDATWGGLNTALHAND